MQRLERVLAVASRPGRCPHAPGVGSRRRVLSAAGQGLAPAGSPMAHDVIVRLGWWRQESRAPYRELHAALASQGRISASHVGSLSHQGSGPLLACHARQHRDRLAPMATQQGGWRVALDGAPPGGAPPMGCIRALSRGVPWRRGWLCSRAPVLQPCSPCCNLWRGQAGRAERQAHGRGTGRGPGRAPPSPSVLSGP